MKFGSPTIRELDLVDYDEIIEKPAPPPPPPPPAPSFYVSSKTNVVTSVEAIIDEGTVKYKVEMILNGLNESRTNIPSIGDIIDIGFGGNPLKGRVLNVTTINRDVDVMNFFDGPQMNFYPGRTEYRLELVCEAMWEASS